MLKLLFLFVAIPAIELALLIEVGSRVGTLATLAIIVGTGALGAALARAQGLSVVATIRDEMNQGRMPTGPILNGVIILLAAVVLMTPGFLTDLFGFLCLIPATRRLITTAIRSRVEAAIRSGQAGIYVHVEAPVHPSDRPSDHPSDRHDQGQPVIDVTPTSDPHDRGGR